MTMKKPLYWKCPKQKVTGSREYDRKGHSNHMNDRFFFFPSLPMKYNFDMLWGCKTVKCSR